MKYILRQSAKGPEVLTSVIFYNLSSNRPHSFIQQGSATVTILEATTMIQKGGKKKKVIAERSPWQTRQLNPCKDSRLISESPKQTSCSDSQSPRNENKHQVQSQRIKPGALVNELSTWNKVQFTFLIFPVVKFHTSMKPSTEPVTRYCPSGENRAHSTCDFCPNCFKGEYKLSLISNLREATH